jgi:filamin
VKPGIAPNASTLDPSKPRQNCTIAAKIAQSYLKIPQIISPDDISSGDVDELSVMTYLSYFVEPSRSKLLRSVQRQLPQSNISGLVDDWYNGKAFGALVRSCFPSVFINWAELEMGSDRDYIKELFLTLKRKLGITPPFEASDLADQKVEELQIMTLIMLIQNGSPVPLSDEVKVRGPGIEGANFQKETSFLIDTSEAGPGQLYIDAIYEENGKKLKYSLKEKTSRIFSLTYTPIKSSKIIFDIQWSEVRIPQSPFTVLVTDSTLVKIVDFESHSTVVEVGKPLSLLLDARKAGASHLTAHLQYSREKIQATVTTLPNGNTKLGYTPKTSGTAVLHIFLNKEELYHLAVTYTVLDVGGYSIHSLPKDKIYSVFEELGFWVLSGKGLPLGALQMTAILDLDVQIPIKLQSTEGKKGYATFTPTLPGIYRVEVVCVDQLIKGTPFNIRVSDPQSCKIKGAIPTHLEIAKPFVFEIDTKEAGVGDITFESSDYDDVSSIFKSRLKHPSSADQQKLEVTPLMEGSFQVGIKYEKKWISNSPFRLQICDPSKFRVMDKPTTASVGKPVEFTINSKERSTESIVVKANGPSAKYSPEIRLGEDGLTYSVTFTPWEIGNHEISIKCGAFPIPDSPITLPVITFDSNACSAAGSGLQKAYSSIPAHFLVLSQQEGLLDDSTLQIRVSSVVDNSDCRIRARDNKNGTYSIAYLIQKPGAYLISIVTAGQHIPGSPFRLNALPGPDAHKCNMYGPALEEQTILTFGKPIDFTVNTSKAGTGKLSVKAIGPDGVPARVFTAKSGRPGVYDISIDALRHGKHRVSVKWSNQHIPSSPFQIKVFPGADSRKCIAHGPGLEDGLVGKKSSFTIETKNAGAGLLKVRLHGLKGAFKIEMAPVDQKNRRTLLANYNPTRPGEYLITIKWSDMHVPGSPFRVKIVGDGTEDAPTTLLYTPTPRLPEVSGFPEFGDSEEDNTTSDDTMQKGSSTQLNPINFQRVPSFRSGHRKRSNGKVVSFSKLPVVRKESATRPSPMPGTKTKKSEFEGQAVVRVKKKVKRGRR